MFTDLRNVEIVHREFLRTALGSQAVPDVTGSINAATLNSILASREGIIGAARLLEHLGVSGLNGAGKYLLDARNLLLAGKFVSVEARHAAALLDISLPAGVSAAMAFASDDIVDRNGMDVKLEAGAVLVRAAAQGGARHERGGRTECRIRYGARTDSHRGEISVSATVRIPQRSAWVRALAGT